MNSYHLYESVSRSIPFLMSLICLSLISLQPVVAQNTDSGATEEQTIKGKIQNALSAAPHYIAREAAVWDWPTESGGDLPILREGSNNWTCFPDTPRTPENDPMCHDEAFLDWLLARLRGEEPDIDRIGLSYMLAGGGFVDDEGELVLGPHVMIVLPNLSDAEGIPHADYSDAPHIFHGGTPYEIIVMPVAAAGEKIGVVQE